MLPPHFVFTFHTAGRKQTGTILQLRKCNCHFHYFPRMVKRKKIIVLGAGMVGSAIALDLAKNYEVTAVDQNASALNELKARSDIKVKKADLSDKKKVSALVSGFDLVIGAVPGFMGFQTVKTVIEAGKNMVDISFFPEDAFLLNKRAQQKKVTVVVDCGVAPGLSNMVAGYHHGQMPVERFECYVGGLPKHPKPPFEYKAPFSPIDVIEEYTRPARIVKNGMEVVVEPLSEVELLNFPFGRLEAFNSDGLRSLIKTLNIPNMKEKTMRYPGHAHKMRLLKEAGFFSRQPLVVYGKKIIPLQFTTSLLFPQWKLEKEEKEFTAMRMLIAGNENGRAVTYQYDLYDEYDEKTGISSMSRTTGYTCAAVAQLVLEGSYTQRGISPSEYVGAQKECFKQTLDYLKARGIQLKVKKKQGAAKR